MTNKNQAGSGKKMPKLGYLAPGKGMPQQLTLADAEAACGGMRKAGGDPGAAGKVFLSMRKAGGDPNAAGTLS